MKFKITKTCTGTLDTAIERKRIAKAFNDQPDVRKKLNQLMDAVEAQDWKSAAKQLHSRWWQGWDKKYECPRLEFIGTVDVPTLGMDRDMSYLELIARIRHNLGYKIERIGK